MKTALACYQAYQQAAPTFHPQSFQDYISTTAAWIAINRHDAALPVDQRIVQMNTPFEICPPRFNRKRGMLLIHGFLGSPHSMQALGQFYAQQGFLVRAILLPGHGTRPGDLLTATASQWQAAVTAGIQSLSMQCQQVHLTGFSLGALLACLACAHHDIRSLCLLAPAFQISRLAAFLPLLRALSQIPGLSFLRWRNTIPETHWAMYQAFPAVAAYEVLKAVKQAACYPNNALPTFMAASTDDATVKFPATQKAFQHCRHPHKHLLVFSKKPWTSQDANTTVISSVDPTRHIVDLSHIALPIADTDSYLGEHGTYYQQDGHDYTYGEMLIGRRNQHTHFRRLTYNPHFDVLLAKLKVFVEKL